MAIIDINKALEAFEDESRIIKASYKDILSLIESGKIPTQEQLSDCDAHMDSLLSHYTDIYSLASEVVDSTPEKGLSVFEYQKLYEESKIIELRRILDEAKDILNKFLNVRAYAKNYMDAVSPYQQEAKVLLESLEINKSIELENSLEGLTGPKVFIEALAQDPDSPEAGNIAIEINKYFSPLVLGGLFAGKYYIDDKSMDIGEKKDVEKSVDRVTDNLVTADAVASKDKILKKEDNTSSDVNVDENIPSENKERVTAKGDEKNKGKRTFIDEIRAMRNRPDYKVKTGFDENVLAFVVDNEKEPTESQFRTVLKRLKRRCDYVADILLIINQFGFISFCELLGFVGGVKCEGVLSSEQCVEDLNKCLDDLKENGLVIDYSASDSGYKHYSLTHYCKKGMSYPAIASQFFQYVPKIRNMAIKDALPRDYVDALDRDNYVYMCYLVVSNDGKDENEFYSKLQSFVPTDDGNMQFDVYENGKSYSCVLYDKHFAKEYYANKNVLVMNEYYKPRRNALQLASNIFYLHDSGISRSEEELDSENIEEKHLVEDHIDESNVSNTEDSTVIDVEEVDNQNSETIKDQQELNEDITVVEVDVPTVMEAESLCLGDSSLDTNSNVDIEVVENTTDKEISIDDNISINTEEEIFGEEIAYSGDDEIESGTDDSGLVSIFDVLKSKECPEDSAFVSIVKNLLETATVDNGGLQNALMLARAASYMDGYTESREIADQLELSTNILLSKKYDYSDFSNAFPNTIEEEPALLLSASCFAMLCPAIAHDYALKSHIEDFYLNWSDYFSHLKQFKALFSKIKSIQAVSPVGITQSIVMNLNNADKHNDYYNAAARCAVNLMSYSASNIGMKKLAPLFEHLFGKKSDIYNALSQIHTKNLDKLEMIHDFLDSYCDFNKENLAELSESKLDDKIDIAWYKENPGNEYQLISDARNTVHNQIKQRVELIIEWYNHVMGTSANKEKITKLNKLRKDIIQEVDRLGKDSTWRNVEYSVVLEWMLLRIKEILNGTNDDRKLFINVLKTGIISIDHDFRPILDERFINVRFYEPWRNVLSHIISKQISFEEVRDEVNTKDMSRFDNLNQLERISCLEGYSDIEGWAITSDQKKNAREMALDCKAKFLDVLEIAFTFGQVTEEEKEDIRLNLEGFQEDFFDIADYACWRDFIAALEKEIEVLGNEKKQILSEEITARLQKGQNEDLLRKAEVILNEDKNYSVVEEFINRFDSGQVDFVDLDLLRDSNIDYFHDMYLAEDSCKLFQELNNNILPFSMFAKKWIENNLPESLSNEESLSRRSELYSYWPKGKGDSQTRDGVKKLLSMIGFDVKSVDYGHDKKLEVYKASIIPVPHERQNFQHPIAAFGTDIDTFVPVIVVSDNVTPNAIASIMSDYDHKLGCVPIVILSNSAWDIGQRRTLARLNHEKNINPYLVFDQALLLFMSKYDEAEYIQVFLKCTLPFTTYQPFTNGVGNVDEEMFFGRKHELHQILDPKGDCIVYGGRQLGKTVLLQRAQSISNDSKNNHAAVYVSIFNKSTENDVVSTILAAIRSKLNITIPSCKTMVNLANNLDKVIDKHKYNYFLLLIDEVDAFLNSIADNGYRELEPLINLRVSSNNKFKFVIAGLHNVVRAEQASRENSIFGKLGRPICVKPLPPEDALRLLKTPMKYLGFEIENDIYLMTILTRSNYYPGILQYVGYEMINALNENFDKYYSSGADVPPYKLTRELLGAVLNNKDLNENIRDKFFFTLDLDPRYKKLAMVMALLYTLHNYERNRQNWTGYTVQDIRNGCELCDATFLDEESDHAVTVLLDEMESMGVLAKPQEGRYRFRTLSYLDIIGHNEEYLIDEINKDVE